MAIRTIVGGQTVLAGQNLVTNPSLETNSTGYGFDADYTRSNESAQYGTFGVKQVSTTSFANLTYGPITVAQNTDYTLSIYAKITVNSGLAPNYQINVDSAFGTTVASGSFSGTSGSFVRFTKTFNSGAHTSVYFRVFNNNGNVACYYDGLQVELGTTATAYIDGDQPGCVWDGTSHASTSTRAAVYGATRIYQRDNFINCLMLDGVSQYARTTTIPSTATNNFTFAAWFRWDLFQSGQHSLIVTGWDGPASGSGSALYVDGDSQTLKGQYGFVANFDSGFKINVGQWYHGILVRDAGVASLYLNGVVSPNTSASTPNTPSAFATIGASSQADATLNRFFGGLIDEVKIFDRAITSAEAMLLYSGLSCSSVALVWNIKFNDVRNSLFAVDIGTAASNVTLFSGASIVPHYSRKNDYS